VLRSNSRNRFTRTTAEALSEPDRIAELGAKILKLRPTSQGFDVAGERVLALVGRAG
jgi:hypothetical protein